MSRRSHRSRDNSSSHHSSEHYRSRRDHRTNRKRKSRFEPIDNCPPEKRKRSKWADAPKEPDEQVIKQIQKRMLSTNAAIALKVDKDIPMGNNTKFREKIYFPKDGVNYTGLLIGPRGAFQKKLENDTGCKILLRGKETNKSGDKLKSDESEEQHALVLAPTQEVLQRGIEAVQKIVFADSKTKQEMRYQQLSIGNSMNNNTLQESISGEIPDSLMTLTGPPSKTAFVMSVPDG